MILQIQLWDTSLLPLASIPTECPAMICSSIESCITADAQDIHQRDRTVDCFEFRIWPAFRSCGYALSTARFLGNGNGNLGAQADALRVSGGR